MPPSQISFKIDEAVRVPLNTDGAAAQGIVDNLPFKQIDSVYRFSPMGGIPVMMRGGLVRLAFFKLLGTGILAGLVAIREEDAKVAFSCALAAAVNAVAAGHYVAIWKSRAQYFPPGFEVFQAGRDKNGVWKGQAATEGDQDKIFLAEMFVDGWRHSDWAVRSRCVAPQRPPFARPVPNKISLVSHR